MKQKQELKELLERLKKWKEGKEEDQELDEIVTTFESFFDPAGDDSNGSNPPGHGPGTPP